MNKFIELCAVGGLFMFCSCGTRSIDEKYAVAVVKDKLSISAPLTAQELKGGLSGAKLFTVTSPSQKYVVRFLSHKTSEKRKNEMYALKIASENGYGPRVYFIDNDQGIVIMEYLASQPITILIVAGWGFLCSG